MAASKLVWGFMLAATLGACGGETAAPAANDAATPAGQAGASAETAVATAPTGAGPLDGLWRCKMNGDIPLGTLTFTGGNYAFQTTNTAWEPNPNSSDGSGAVRFEENFVLPQSGPLKDSFEVTGAFGDGAFINFNNNGGLLFGCRRP
jgi:hypothetical protein